LKVSFSSFSACWSYQANVLTLRSPLTNGQSVTVWYRSIQKAFHWTKLWLTPSLFAHIRSIICENNLICRLGNSMNYLFLKFSILTKSYAGSQKSLWDLAEGRDRFTSLCYPRSRFSRSKP
jgi:hypothetical protein